MENQTRIGIALSGGGVRGISHLGVLKAMDEVGLIPSAISGTSAGAIAGVMYAKGFAPDEILEIIIQTNYFKFIWPSVSWKGILKMDQVIPLYEKYLGVDDFSSLRIPMTMAATDLHLGQTVYFSSGELIRPLMASSCIPGMFEPILLDGRYFIDGGVLNNMPVEPLQDSCDVIIGVNCNHLPIEQNIRHIKSLIERTVIMSMNYNVYSRRGMCDHFVEPPGLARFGVLEIKKAKEIFEIGYQTMMEYISLHLQQDGIATKSII
ncbi:patatin-like phospholipase family protein [Lunatibacter salilacus]|uniref:patatin-like phospholipase family protein n=1 Tax=Lunatibacter salilacus TaxID=2483804 RepID=UPI00131C4EE8|nr:patatin-like phospholipase family protein [Lunatibacter salilacus]